MPVDRGLPPVTWPTRPGKESEGKGVSALPYSRPWWSRAASTECGWFFTYQVRSCWCKPSTEISSTCLMLPWPGCPVAAEARVVPPSTAVTLAAMAAARPIVFVRMMSSCQAHRISAPSHRSGRRRQGAEQRVTLPDENQQNGPCYIPLLAVAAPLAGLCLGLTLAAVGAAAIGQRKTQVGTDDSGARAGSVR